MPSVVSLTFRHLASFSATVTCVLLLTVCVLSPGSANAGPLEDADKKLVLEFYEVVLNGRDADAAPTYVAEGYIQHNPRVPSGLAALQGFVRELRRIAPDARSTVKRVVSEGGLVVLHSLTQRNPQDRGVAQVDIFRVQDGKIVEHWDVMQPIPEVAANSNGVV